MKSRNKLTTNDLLAKSVYVCKLLLKFQWNSLCSSVWSEGKDDLSRPKKRLLGLLLRVPDEDQGTQRRHPVCQVHPWGNSPAERSHSSCPALELILQVGRSGKTLLSHARAVCGVSAVRDVRRGELKFIFDYLAAA